MRSKATIGVTTAASLAVCTVAFVALVVLDRQTGTLRAATTPWTIMWLSVAFAGFLAAVWGTERRPLSTQWIWGTAIGFRLLMLATEPTLSDDVFRYLWDGHLFSEGVNPYSHPISAAAVDPYEIEVRRRANNPHLASPYLPMAHIIFGFVATALPLKALSIQAIMTGFDLATAGLIARLLSHVGLPTHRVGLYLWHPLVIVELSHGAHLDGAMTFFAFAALAATVASKAGTAGQDSTPDKADTKTRRWWWLSPLLLAMAVLTRPLPLLLTPILWWRWQWRQRILFGLSTVAFLIPFSFGRGGLGLDSPSSGTGVFGSARVYASDFRFNGGLSHWLRSAFGDQSPIPSLFVAITMAFVGLVVWRTAKTVVTRSSQREQNKQNDLLRHLRLGAIPLMAYVLLTPVFHPWYLVILLAFLPFLTPLVAEQISEKTTRNVANETSENPRRWLLLSPWLFLSAAVPLSYLTYVDPNRFAQREWVRLVEWLPTLTLTLLTAMVAWSLTTERTSANPDQPVRIKQTQE